MMKSSIRSFRNMVCSVAAVGFAMASGGSAAFAAGPLITQYGTVAPVMQPGELPDTALEYKVVMNVTSAGPEGEPPPALEAAARLANLLTESGVPAGHRHIVVVLHGAATSAVLNEAAARAKGRGVNPSADLISKLTDAGISVRVCGQSLAKAKIEQADVLKDVQVDLSAITTLSTLQLRGFALLPD